MAITSAAKNYSDSALTELHFKVLKVSDFLIKIPKVESYYIRHYSEVLFVYRLRLRTMRFKFYNK